MAAVPANSPELPADLFGRVEGKRLALDQAEAADKAAKKDAANISVARAASIKGLESELKNRGYDLTATESEAPDEIIITSSDFSDTDHRVRFLSTVRAKYSVNFSVCLNGYDKVRLRSSRIPFAGFDESYSLECQ